MLVILGIIIRLGIAFVMIYNKIVELRENVRRRKNDIDVQLDVRGKIFDSLINTVKKYMEHEEGVLTKIVELRNTVKVSSDEKELKYAEEELSNLINSNQLSKGIDITMEAYPDLKANENMLQLQEEIATTERKLGFAKQSFNQQIDDYNTQIQSLFSSIVVSFIPKLKEDFEYWKISDSKRKEEEEKTVKL